MGNEAQDAAALAPLSGGLAGAIDENSSRRDETRSWLCGRRYLKAEESDAAPTWRDAFSQQGGEFVDESSEGAEFGRRRRPWWRRRRERTSLLPY